MISSMAHGNIPNKTNEVMTFPNVCMLAIKGRNHSTARFSVLLGILYKGIYETKKDHF